MFYPGAGDAHVIDGAQRRWTREYDIELAWLRRDQERIRDRILLELVILVGNHADPAEARSVEVGERKLDVGFLFRIVIESEQNARIVVAYRSDRSAPG